MSFKDLTKEQKQYVALGGLAAAILVILMVLGIRFSMATVSAAKEELDDLSGKISKANKALSRSKQTTADYVDTAVVLRDYMKNAPPERNYYSWATEVIYATARFAGLEIDSIDEVSVSQLQQSGPNDSAASSFESYSLRIMAYGGYENTKYFLNLLKQDYPLVRFSGVEISSGQNREKHNVQLFMQWPFNFGEISKKWDAVANKKVKVADLSEGDKTADLKERESVDKPTALEASITQPSAGREPYPPTTRPEEKEAPVSEPVAEPKAPKAEAPAAPVSTETVPKLTTNEESETTLSHTDAPGAESMGAEPQAAITAYELAAEPMTVPEVDPIASESEPVSMPADESEPGPSPMIEQEVLPVNGELETNDFAVPLASPQVEPVEVSSQMDASSTPEVDSAPETLIGPQPLYAGDKPHNDLSIDKSETQSEEPPNKESAEEDISMSSLLEDMMGENNAK